MATLKHGVAAFAHGCRQAPGSPMMTKAPPGGERALRLRPHQRLAAFKGLSERKLAFATVTRPFDDQGRMSFKLSEDHFAERNLSSHQKKKK